jgi:hypothetical protein
VGEEDGVKIRPVFRLSVRPEPGVSDAVKALRIWLKNGLRAHGLRCIEIYEEQTTETDNEGANK